MWKKENMPGWAEYLGSLDASKKFIREDQWEMCPPSVAESSSVNF